ncbi:hypothetical protein [Streptomyces sp. NPDC048191]|uniref:hypothetical protein n=1 Tax=Streptomyces sp. NPDC048191 TaxID=3155484 RepID=UPI00340A7FF0
MHPAREHRITGTGVDISAVFTRRRNTGRRLDSGPMDEPACAADGFKPAWGSTG